ncbi:MAG: spermidine synthase [bacterium]|nr:spermidine synthase [bacterium]
MSRPWNTLGRFETSEGELELRRRGPRDFLITVAGRVLMNSQASRSEQALGERAATEVASRPRPRVLIGGLGMACTLRAVLDALPADAEVVVAELHEGIVDWCRGPLAELTDAAICDPRVTVELGDVTDLIRQTPAGTFDALVLDLYEGPPPGARSRRDPHFGERALAHAHRALAPGGVFAIWAEDPDPTFEKGLRNAGFETRHERPGRGGRRHVIYLATRDRSS